MHSWVIFFNLLWKCLFLIHVLKPFTLIIVDMFVFGCITLLIFLFVSPIFHFPLCFLPSLWRFEHSLLFNFSLAILILTISLFLMSSQGVGKLVFYYTVYLESTFYHLDLQGDITFPYLFPFNIMLCLSYVLHVYALKTTSDNCTIVVLNFLLYF